MPYAIDVEAARVEFSDEELTAAVRGERPELDPRAALKLLARRGSDALDEAARQALADRRREPSLRLAAVRALAALGPRRGQAHLLAALVDDPAPQVSAAVVAALGAIGDAEAAAALETFKPTQAARLDEALAFARTLASHRLRTGAHLVALPAARRRLRLDLRAAASIAIEPEPFAQATLFAQVQSRLPGHALSARGAMHLHCAGNELLALFAAGFDQAAGLASLAQRSAVPIVLFETGRSRGQPYLVYWFLARPGKDRGSANLVGVRPQGQAGYAGMLGAQGEDYVLRLQALASVHTTATAVEAIYTPSSGQWQIVRALSHPQIDRQRSPVKRPQPALRPA